MRRREIDKDIALEIYDLHLDAPFEIREPDRRDVLTVTLDYEATVYDAVHISLGLTLNAPLITAEKSTTPWVTKMGDGAISIS